MELAGTRAIVTGGASGIGLATAELLLAGGARVLLVDVDDDRGTAAARRLGAAFLRADVASVEAWEEIEHAVVADLGGMEIAHLNAGVASGAGDITALTDAQYQRTVGINVNGVVYGIRALVPHIEAAGGGSVLITSSLAGLMGFTPDPVYTLTKHALTGLVRALAPQLAAKDITINAICPNVTATPAIGPLELWEKAGFEVMPVSQVAQAGVDAITGGETGQSIVCQPGREPLPYRFRNVPGPRSTAAPGGAQPTFEWPGSR